MEAKRLIAWVLAVILTAISAVLYFKESHYWYNYLVFGMLFLFDNLSHARKNKTTLDLIFKKKYKKFLVLFFWLFVLGMIIELIGHFWLGFWYYKFINPPSEHIIANIIGFLTYPLVLMSFREMYNFIHSFIKNLVLSVVLSMILGITIWEIPTLHTKDWVYNFPYISLEIFGLNIVVISGWTILILSPRLVYKLVDIFYKK